MKYRLEIELDFEDWWVDESDGDEIRWLEGLLDQPENKFLIGGDIGDFVDGMKVLSYKRINEEDTTENICETLRGHYSGNWIRDKDFKRYVDTSSGRIIRDREIHMQPKILLGGLNDLR
jgi:hypothetical protein